MSRVTGNCLCGSVRFEVEDDFHQLNFCHCKQCQRVTGSAHASNLFTAPDNIRWVSGNELVKRFDTPGRSISSAFCTECGSGLPYVSLAGKLLVVPAGTLNESFESKPAVANIFWTERAHWYETGLASTRHDKFAS